MSTADGAWYAICATTKDRITGVVHCYPANHDPAQVFRAGSAAFVNVGGGPTGSRTVVAALNVVHDGGKQFVSALPRLHISRTDLSMCFRSLK